MTRSIERALDVLVARREPITVRNTIAAYLQIVNFNGGDVQLDDAMVAFEHALDKHPLPLAGNDAVCYYRPYVLEVDQLRRDYWAERMGGAKCTCGKCGCPIFEETQPSADVYDQSINASYGAPKEKRKAKGGNYKSKKKRATKKRVSDSSDISLLKSADPCSSSTSTSAL